MCPTSPLTDAEIAERSGRVVKTKRSDKIGQSISAISVITTKNESIDLSVLADDTHILLFFYPDDKKALIIQS